MISNNFDFVFSTEEGTVITPAKIFYKSQQRALVVIGLVSCGALSLSEQLEVKGKKFSIKQLQVDKVQTELVNSNEWAGIQLDAKPSFLHKLGVIVEF